MIDWPQILGNALWIGGAALALAVVSYASWAAHQQQQKLRVILGAAAYQCALYGAGLLFCLGLAVTAVRWWEALLWAALGLGCVVQFVLTWRTLHRTEMP
jgi:hypothetical protein